jgi:hypothetical protein
MATAQEMAEIEFWLRTYNIAWRGYDEAEKRGDTEVMERTSKGYEMALARLEALGVVENTLVRDPANPLTWMLPPDTVTAASQ